MARTTAARGAPSRLAAQSAAPASANAGVEYCFSTRSYGSMMAPRASCQAAKNLTMPAAIVR